MGDIWGDALYIKQNTYNVSNTCQIQDLNLIYEKYFGYSSNRFFVEIGAYDGETFSKKRDHRHHPQTLITEPKLYILFYFY